MGVKLFIAIKEDQHLPIKQDREQDEDNNNRKSREDREDRESDNEDCNKGLKG